MSPWFHSSIKLQSQINNAAVKLVSTKRKKKKKRKVKEEKKLVKITALPPPHFCLGEPRFQNSSFLDNYPTVQPVLNLWSSPFKESSYRMNARPRRNNILYTTKAAPGTATALLLHPPTARQPSPSPPSLAIVIKETLPSTYTELAILLSSLLRSFLAPFSPRLIPDW